MTDVRAHRALLLAFLGIAATRFALGDVPGDAHEDPIDRRIWHAAPPLEAPASEIASTARALSTADRANVVILYRATEIHFDDLGKQSKREHTIYQVHDAAAAASWTAVSATWSPRFDNAPSIRARVIDADGIAHRLEPAHLARQPLAAAAGNQASAQQVLFASLPAVGDGVVIETLIEQSEHQPLFPAGAVRRHVFVATAPILDARLHLDTPETLPLTYRLHDPERPAGNHTEDDAAAADRAPARIASGETTLNGRRVIRFTHSDLSTAQAIEPNQPPEQARWPSLTFSTAASWNAVATAYAALVDDALAEGKPGEQDLAADGTGLAVGSGVVAPGAVASDSIDDLLAQVRARVRPVDTPLGSTTWRPASPRSALAKGAGTSLDLATLLVAMLRQSAIPAFVALVRSGPGQGVEPDLPGVGLFDRAVVYVPGLRPLWLDPATASTRAGELPHAAQDRWALILSASTQNVVKTPASGAADNRQEELREVYLAPYGPARVVETTDFYGAFAQHQRALRATTTTASRQQQVARYVATTYLGARLEGLEEVSSSDAVGPLSMRLEAIGSARASTELDQAVVGIPLADFVAGMPADFFATAPAPRVHPYLQLPFARTWRYRIHPPRGFAPRTLPPARTFELGAATLQQSFRLDDGILIADFRFDSGPRRKSAAAFAATRRALREWVDEQPVELLWFDSVGATMLRHGNAIEAVQSQAAIASAPDAAVADQVRLGRALLALGLVESARTIAVQTLAAAPKSSLAHWFHGTVLARDPLGRPWLPGSDRAGALAAFERAVALDPDHELAHAELLLALERGEDGTRFGPGVDLARAAQKIRTFRSRFGGAQANRNLAEVLLRAQDGPALSSLADDLPISAEHHVWGLVGTALTAGADAVKGRVDRLQASSAARASYLVQAAQKLVSIRHYASAATLLKMAVPATGEAQAARAAAGLAAYAAGLAETVPLHQISEPDDPGRRLLLRLLRLIRGNDVPLESIFHSRWLAAVGPDRSNAQIVQRARERFTAGRVGAGQNDERLGDAGLPEAVVLDLAYHFVHLARDGDPDGLERLVIRASLPGPTETFGEGTADGQTLLLATDASGPVDDRRRIIGFGSDLGSAGRMITGLLADDEVDQARQWLDWLAGNGQERTGAQPVEPGHPVDPFRGHPFPQIWPGSGAPTPDRMAEAAAVLMAWADDPELIDDAVARLTATVARLAATHERWPPLANALYQALLARDAVTARGGLTARMSEAFPESAVAFERRIGWLLTTRAFADAEALARGRLAARSNDQLARRMLAQVAMARGDVTAAHRGFATLQPLPENAAAFNQHAWLQLFPASATDDGAEASAPVERARQAAALLGYPAGPILHTLATALAAEDQPSEAYRTLLRAVDARGGTIDPEDYLVLGRIAEAVGREDAARYYYQRVEAGVEGITFSAHDLADAWRSRLDGQSRTTTEP